VLQLRILTPTDLTDRVLATLRDEVGVATITIDRGAAIEPPGDVVMAEIATERAHELLERLRSVGIERRGSISVSTIDVAISASGRRAERDAPGRGADSLLWERVESEAREHAALSVTFLVLMVIAAIIATVGIAVDSAVLIIGAMIVGPEFGPLAGIAVGAYRRQAFGRTALLTLAAGLVVAILAAAATAAIAHAVGQSDAEFDPASRFFTAFVTQPNAWSVVVALAAGVAGMIALGQGRSTLLPGVLVSVTTIPAAAAIGVDAAVGNAADLGDAALQLSINLVAIVAAGIATLAVHDRWWAAADHAEPRRSLP
jgi:uncharacterized hydrophobic protein (TIGR00271 family)